LETGRGTTAGSAIVDVSSTQGCWRKFGDAQPRREALVLSPWMFAIKKEPQPFVMMA